MSPRKANRSAPYRAGRPALQALFAGSQDIEAARYDAIRVRTCVEEDYEIQLKGVVSLGGSDYHTTSGADPLALTADGPGYLKMANFSRETRSGTMSFPQHGHPSIPYGAVKLP